MNGIVEELRSKQYVSNPLSGWLNRAADEIERLQEARNNFRSMVAEVQGKVEEQEAEIAQLKNELAKAQFQPNNRKLTRDIIRSLILEIKTLRLELRQAQVMQVKSDQQTGS